MSKASLNDFDVRTVLTHAGHHSDEHFGFVNTPVFRGSTVLFPDVDTMLSGKQRYGYGRVNNPSTSSLAEAISAIEGAAGTVLCPSGLSACTTAILAVASAGDHILIPDSAYSPTRHFCDTAAKRFGIDTTFYDPTIGSGIEALFRPNTRAVFTESPGSYTFEIQDIPAIVDVAHCHNAVVITDNTWGTPLFCKPLALGVDLSLMAATKYVVGHSDTMIGTIAASERLWPQLKDFHYQMGLFVSPDDVTLALRGLRTMGVRLQQHQANALKVAHWLESHPDVTRVIHPALPSHPQHALWQRDFTGSSGLFSFITREAPFEAAKALIDSLQLFGLGFSWGGYESLVMPADPRKLRTATQWNEPGHLIRLHIGLESADDLIGDLERGLAVFAKQAP